jgi:hypothetical protein
MPFRVQGSRLKGQRRKNWSDGVLGKEMILNAEYFAINEWENRDRKGKTGVME